MVRKIVKGTHIFSEKAIPATPADKQVITDLLDTLRGEPGNLRWNGSKYDWHKQSDYCSGSRPISICNGESGDYEEVRRLQHRGKLSFAGWSQSLHKIPGDRGGLSEW